MGCFDGATVTVHSPEGTWQPGNYKLEITTAGQAHSCQITLPDDAPTQPGASASLACVPTFDAGLVPETECTQSSDGEVVSQSCTPIAGQYFFSVALSGTPPDVDVRLARDASELLHESRALEYKDFSPNGVECGPTCRVATLELVVP
jgi:hypothetical protein